MQLNTPTQRRLRPMPNSKAEVDIHGTQRWYKNSKLHRDDGPAVIYRDGEQRWFKNGKLHRDDGPAVIRPDGERRWFKHGKNHREDGPAVTYHDGSVAWSLNNTICTFADFCNQLNLSDQQQLVLALAYNQ